ncbi:MAG: hypothetical protein HZB56_23185 [Deltaproteobacteria bacterium]|nr:hypothetical protein [Deltaproteobacteria bacterium]
MRTTWSSFTFVGALAAGAAALALSGCGVEIEQVAQPTATRTTQAAMVQSAFCPDADSCPGTGAHDEHAAYSCRYCHFAGGRIAFQKDGPAYRAGQPAPAWDAATQTCSNVGCHSIAAGTFAYWFPDGSGEPAYNVVSYGGGPAQTTPSWYATGAGCGACHGNPPRNGSSGSNVWHSGQHAGTAASATNQCQFCHPDATGSGGAGTAITNPSLHGNGAVNVQANFQTSCFGCH